MSRAALDKAEQLFKRGVPIGKVIEQTGITRHMARKLRSACGYKTVRLRIERLLEENKSYGTPFIAAVVGCSEAHVNRVKRELFGYKYNCKGKRDAERAACAQ